MQASYAEPTSSAAWLRWAQATLQTITERPRLEAELLMAHVMKATRAQLIAHPEHLLTTEQAKAFYTCVQQRAQHVPLPYITGCIEFYDLSFAVTPAVLIPRPETEGLVELALVWLSKHPYAITVDVGAGSGCIAVTLGRHMSNARIIAVDLSAEALTVAQDNARAHGVAGQITFIRGDLLTPLSGGIDMIVSNPPYVAEAEWHELPPSVKEEPRLALLGGADGLDIIRRLLAQAKDKLSRHGCMLLEIGEQQGRAVHRLAQAAFPDAEVSILPDLAQKERYARIERATPTL